MVYDKNYFFHASVLQLLIILDTTDAVSVQEDEISSTVLHPVPMGLGFTPVISWWQSSESPPTEVYSLTA